MVGSTFRGQRSATTKCHPTWTSPSRSRDCSLELKDQRAALEAIKDDLRQWEGLDLQGRERHGHGRPLEVAEYGASRST